MKYIDNFKVGQRVVFHVSDMDKEHLRYLNGNTGVVTKIISNMLGIIWDEDQVDKKGKALPTGRCDIFPEKFMQNNYYEIY